MSKSEIEPWLVALDEEDRAFLKRFLLASGSLKEVARAYGISYPTVRIRLDRLIDKVRVHDETRELSAFERTARTLYTEGKLSAETLKTLLEAHRENESNTNRNNS